MDGRLSGLHYSAQPGASVEFAEHKEYSPGDDLRHMNWKAYARSNKFYVRQFTKETHTSFHIVLDASSSMRFGSGFAPYSKLEYACRLSLALSHVLLHQNDGVGLLALRGGAVRDYVPPRSHPSHLVVLEEALHRLSKEHHESKAEGWTDFVGAMEFLVGLRLHRSAILLVTDLFTELDPLFPYLAYLASQGNYIWMAHVLDPAEYDSSTPDSSRTLPFDGTLFLRSEETGHSVLMDCRLNRRDYLERFGQYLETVREKCAEARVRYHLANTDVDPVEFLLRSVMER